MMSKSRKVFDCAAIRTLKSLGTSLAVLFGLHVSPAHAQLYGVSNPFQFDSGTFQLPDTLSADRDTFLNQFPKVASIDEEIAETRRKERASLDRELTGQMAEVLNRVRAEPRVCGEKSYAAAGPLKHNAVLANAAGQHTKDMIRNRFFAHQGTDGTNGGKRIERTGYRWRNWGENLAAGFESVDTVVEGWLASPSHCANLMNPKFQEFGIHKATGLDRDEYWTLNMATPL